MGHSSQNAPLLNVSDQDGNQFYNNFNRHGRRGVTNQGQLLKEVTCPEKPATSFIKGSSFHIPMGKEAERPANFLGLL